jgi:hypothetical protein
MFPAEFEESAFRAGNGEFAWSRSQIPAVVAFLRLCNFAILCGELWWVRDGSTQWIGLIPQRDGPPGVYHWETKREPEESWAQFVERSAADTLTAVERWPVPTKLPTDLPGQILYNLTWVAETEL